MNRALLARAGARRFSPGEVVDPEEEEEETKIRRGSTRGSPWNPGGRPRPLVDYDAQGAGRFRVAMLKPRRLPHGAVPLAHPLNPLPRSDKDRSELLVRHQNRSQSHSSVVLTPRTIITIMTKRDVQERPLTQCWH